MIPTPDLKQFLQLAKKGNVIPVSIELPADLESPVSVFLKLASKFANAFLFESVELGERVGRFSLIGFDSDTVIEYARGVATVTRPGKKRQKVKGKFLDVVEKVLKQYQLVQDPTLPPLVGGLAGYIGYELVEQFETIKLTKKKGLSVPDAMLFVPTTLIVFDHIKHSLKLVRLAVVSNTPKRAYQEAVSKLASLAVQLSHPISDGILTPQSKKHRKTPSVRSNMTQKKFESLVKRAKGYIRAGDCIQVVLSQRFDLGTVQDDFQLYRSLRSLNPSPYLFYFRHHKFSLVGSSPEKSRRFGPLQGHDRAVIAKRPILHLKHN
jgi:anthranilate synthase component I